MFDLISIFNGRERSLSGARKLLFMQLSQEFIQKYMRFFRHNNSSDSFTVFMGICSHMDVGGWAFPGHSLLHEYTGIRKPHTMGYLISVLNTIILPMPAGPQKLLNYYSGHQANGHMKSYYHIFPGAGNEDLAPEPFILKELMRPGLVQERKRPRKTVRTSADQTSSPDGEEVLVSGKPYAGVRHMAAEPEPYAGVRHAGLRHSNYSQVINHTHLKPRANARGREETLMSLTPIHLSVQQTMNKKIQRAQVYACPHCTAQIDQHQKACPECGAAIVWTGNDVLAIDERHAALRQPLKTPVYTGAAAWLYLYAMAHQAGVQGERIFYRADKGHDEAAQINRYAELFGEELVQAKATYAATASESHKAAVGRGIIVTTLNLLAAHDPTNPARTAGAGSRRKPRAAAIDMSDEGWEAERLKLKGGGIKLD